MEFLHLYIRGKHTYLPVSSFSAVQHKLLRPMVFLPRYTVSIVYFKIMYTLIFVNHFVIYKRVIKTIRTYT